MKTTDRTLEQAILKQLHNMNKIFGAKKSGETISNLAMFWADVFVGIDPAVFVAATQVVIKENQFFPVPHDVQKHVADIQRRRELKHNTDAAQKQIEMEVPSRAWVEALFVKKGLKDKAGKWIPRRMKIDPKCRPDNPRGEWPPMSEFTFGDAET